MYLCTSFNDIRKEPEVFGFSPNCYNRKTRKLEGYQLTPTGVGIGGILQKRVGVAALASLLFTEGVHALSPNFIAFHIVLFQLQSRLRG